jgi:uncharacterized protein with HEPN domain
MFKSGRFVLSWTAGITFAEFERNDLLRAAVERQFEIIGEAARRLANTDPDIAAALTDVAPIISFRNVLAHAYDAINIAQVWNIIEHFLPTLIAEVEPLLESMTHDAE